MGSGGVRAAHARAIEIGDPLSERLVEYCRANDIPVFDRLVRAHKTLRFVTPRPAEEHLLP
ncbi:MAG TPA: hypothetical protein QGH10_01480 [Armatimonadota bacterium]|nr:hypothetical protein [Armatimonadota bacterium]